ncbi:hypothetical protein RRG08_048819 [Elysia crispata]|uniref:Uncharacterized protein n=1 Tax=Elysia crispata TaxID=231223 RepID=A0AAE1B4A7_9GAST|nr:hypothetical protein RRG08_048819 [Elysia crispata]
MEGDASICCEPLEEHSGQMFDWWRYSKDGRIVNPPKVPPPPPPIIRPPLRTDQLCWPMYQVSRFESIAKESEETKPETSDCEPSKDFWPSKEKTRCVHDIKREHARPPWIPASNPHNTSCCGRVSYPPPYTRNCGDRQKPVQPFICRP